MSRRKTAARDPRAGATMEQVSERIEAIRNRIFEVDSLLQVCSKACEPVPNADHVGASLRLAAERLSDLHGKLDVVTWTNEEIGRCRQGGAK